LTFGQVEDVEGGIDSFLLFSFFLQLVELFPTVIYVVHGNLLSLSIWALKAEYATKKAIDVSTLTETGGNCKSQEFLIISPGKFCRHTRL
jgi:hypothetical protein